MKLEDDVAHDLVKRLRRIEGQVSGIARMIEAGRDCEEIATQVAAASRALDRAGFRLMACGMRQALRADLEGRSSPLTVEQMERIFLSLA